MVMVVTKHYIHSLDLEISLERGEKRGDFSFILTSKILKRV